MRRTYTILALLLALLMLAGCAAPAQTAPATETAEPEAPAQEEELTAESEQEKDPEPLPEEVYLDPVSVDVVSLEEEVAVLADAPAAVPTILKPEASGAKTHSNNEAIIDYSNTADGYVMMQYTATTDKRLKARVQGPTTTYTYNLTPGKWEVFPLSDGNGSYKFTVYRNVTGTKYSTVLSTTASVSLADEFAPFLRPNQYVDYSEATKTMEKAAELVKKYTDPLDKVAAVYDYVVGTLSYDYDKAATVKSGYLPVLDTVLEAKKGICFDYAALMAGMLRSQGIPCKLVVGYAGSAYHAWISVWTEDEGWIDGAIFFNGTAWHRMDPTFASSAKRSSSIMSYIGTDSNYSTKYLY